MSVLDQSQIHSTFVSLVIDGVEYGSIASNSERIIGPQGITSLKVEKSTADASNVAVGFKFTIELNYLMYPDFYETILRLIKQFPDGLIPATIQYGYTDGICSPVYELKILSCEPNDLWTTLTLQFISTESKSKYNLFTDKTDKAFEDNKYYNLSDFVRAVAVNQGWEIGEIVDTIPYADPDVDPDKYIRWVEPRSSNPITAIMQLLTKYPNNSSLGEGSYIAGFKHYVGGSKFYFVPTTELVKEYDFKNAINTYEFYFNALPQGNVLSFKPKLYSALVDASANSQLNPNKLKFDERPDIGVITTDSRELYSVIYDVEDRKLSSIDSTKNLGTACGFVEPSLKIYNVESSNIKEYFRSKITGKMSDYVNVMGVRNVAEMEILGDPSINVMDYVNIIPMYQMKSYTIPNKMHPSGGIYWIKAMVDIIENGTFTTQLDLVSEGQKDFKIGEISALTMAFEQVDNVNNSQLNQKLTEALGKTSTSGGNNRDDGNSKSDEIIKKAVEWAVNIANDDSHQYSNDSRWGPNYDCSSFVISAWQNAGVSVKSHGATSTANMVKVFLGNNFEDVTSKVNLDSGEGLKIGDVLVNENGEGREINTGHTVMVQSSYPDLKIVAANGHSSGINANRDYYNLPYTYVLRYISS